MRLRRKVKFQGAIEQLRGLYAYNPVHGITRQQGPSTVQIQTIDRCNASCVMCPYSTALKSGPPNHMEEGLYSRIIDNLRYAGTVRQVVLMLQNEPLLDNKLAHRVRQAKEALGKAVKIAIVTNGALLSQRRINTLLDAGIDSIEISIDAFCEETYRAIRPGLDFSKVVENVHAALKLKSSALDVVVRFLTQSANKGEERQFRCYWESFGARVFIFSLVNRAGILEGFDRMICPTRGKIFRFKKRLKKTIRDLFIRAAARSCFATPCTLPFTCLNVLWNGQVILCCHDWGPIDIVGDLSIQSLWDVWNGDTINKYRFFLWSNRITESPVCKDCSIAIKR